MFEEYWEINYPLVSVTVKDIHTGAIATGHAKCDPTDSWNPAFGVTLAYKRAIHRVTAKAERVLIRQLNGAS